MYIVVLYLAFHLRGPKLVKGPHTTSVLGPPSPHISWDMGPGGPQSVRAPYHVDTGPPVLHPILTLNQLRGLWLSRLPGL